MKISPTMKNVLEAIIERTTITKGKNKGTIKKRIIGNEYNKNVLYALLERELIDYAFEMVSGTGYAATKKGIELIDNMKGK